MPEPGNDELLAAAVQSPLDVDNQVVDDEERAAEEEERLGAETPADDEPGQEYPERPPAGLDPETGYDPIPPA